MKRYHDDFLQKFEGIEFTTLEDSSSSIYALDTDLKISYLNPAYVKFAEENDPSGNTLSKFPISAQIGDAISDPRLKDYYLDAYKEVLSTGKNWTQEYECSSPETYRMYHQTAYPFKNGKGLIIVNVLSVRIPMDQTERIVNGATENSYTNQDGLIVQCSNCRYTERADKAETWDWVPDLVKQMPENMSHTICPICLDYYWKYGNVRFNPK